MESIVWIYNILFIHISLDGHFHLLVITNNAAINIHIQGFVWTYVFISLGYIPRSWTAGSYGDSVLNCLRNCQTVFQNGYTILHFHQQCSNFSTSSTILVIISLFFITASRGGVNWHLTVVLILTALMTNHIEHFFMYLCLL